MEVEALLVVLERVQEEELGGEIIFSISEVFDDSESFPQPIDRREAELRNLFRLEYVVEEEPALVFGRNKKNLDGDRTRKNGRELIPGGRWRPLKVIHLGLIVARLGKVAWTEQY